MGRPIVTERDFISIPDGRNGGIAVIDVRNQTLTHSQYPGVTFHDPTKLVDVHGRSISLEEWKTLMNEHDPSYVLPSQDYSAVMNIGQIRYIEIYFDKPKPGCRFIVMAPY